MDTGADFSIMRQELVDRLKKVKTPWTGPYIRSAGGQLMTPTGKCTARLRIGDSSFVATFVILPECCKELILGMDFLRDYGAVINIPERLVTFSASPDVDSNYDRQHGHLRLAEDVTMPPRACCLVSVSSERPYHGDVIAEQISVLLLTQGVAIARGILALNRGHAAVLLTNFSNERRHVPKGTAVAFFDDIVQVKDCFAVHDQGMNDKIIPPPATLSVDVSTNLLPAERQRLLELIQQFEDCFSYTSKVKQTPLTKHRIITDDATSPIKQNPYRVAPKEREEIQKHVKKMLEDDVIQPSKSPWASPVVLVKKKTAAYASVLTTAS